MSTCVNCGAEVTTPYCAQCGQRSNVKRITLINMGSDFLSRIYGFDGFFLRTIKELTLRPGKVSREYISGNRNKYYGPVGYLFIMLTIFILGASLIGLDLVEFSLATADSMKDSGQDEQQRAIGITIGKWISDNMRLISFLTALWLVPFVWLFFRKSGNNLLETAVPIFYSSGHIMWLSFISIISYRVFGQPVNYFFLMLISYGYMAFTLIDFYNYLPRWKSTLRAILAMIIAYLMLGVFAAVFGVLYMIRNKEILEKLAPKKPKQATEQSIPE